MSVPYRTLAAALPHATSILVGAPEFEPLTVAEAKLRAGLDWADGDPRDAQTLGYIRAARERVERDTGLALPTQTRDVYFDALPGRIIALPDLSRPLQAVVSITSTDAAGTDQVLDAGQYTADLASGRIASLGWPSDLGAFRPWVIRIVAGWPEAALIPPLLLHAVGLLTAHYMTVGRDVVIIGTIVADTPYGYEDAIAAFRQVNLH